MFTSRIAAKTPSAVKGLLPAALALAVAAGLHVTPAAADSLADYYRTMYTMKFCTVTGEGEEEGSIGQTVEQEVIDQEATSEEIAPIFDQLNAEYNADPEQFCQDNVAGAVQVIDAN